jgi:hypothetical protein
MINDQTAVLVIFLGFEDYLPLETCVLEFKIAFKRITLTGFEVFSY